MGKKKAPPKEKKTGTSAATALDLGSRPGKFVNVNTRFEGRGKDAQQLCADISLRGIHLDRPELEHILGPHAWVALFVEAAKGKPAEPHFRNINPIQCTDEFDGCDLSISHGLSDDATLFDDMFLSKIVLEPQVGGTTLMQATASVEVEDEDDIADLLRVMGDECKVAIMLGGKFVPKDAKAQGKLDLGPANATPPSADKAAAETTEAVH